jgi:hypothetical protein
MSAALDLVVMAREPTAEWAATHEPPPFDPKPFTRAELYRWFRGGEPTADACEKLLAWASRARGGLDLALAEGLHALQQRERLPRHGFHLDDYAREILDLGKRAAETLAQLGRELRTRPLLREALRAGRVRLRAAETVLPVAKGDAEAAWVQRAETLTVRQLEQAVEKARQGGAVLPPDGEDWLRFRARLQPEEQDVVDEGLALAGRLLPGSTTMARLEAMLQEVLGSFPGDPSADERRRLGRSFRPIQPPGAAERAREAALEAETDRWALLTPVGEWPAPAVQFEEAATAQEIDATLRQLADLRARWDDIIGYCAHALRKSRMHQLLGFSTFRHYVEERLGLSGTTVAQRAALQERLEASPALQEARRQKLPYEKLRLLARVPDPEIGAWAPRAHALTCIALRRRLEGERERQMRARRTFSVSLPRRVAVLLAAAIAVVREKARAFLSPGRCLAVIALHAVETWRPALRRSRSGSQRVRARDGDLCTVPGCSHRSAHSHHVVFRSHQGSRRDDNQTGVCGYHHLRCIHPGHLKVFGRAPDGLTWLVGGRPFTGRRG